MELKKSTVWKSYRFPLILLCSIVLGCIAGALLGNKAGVLAPLGDIFVNAMFTVVVPMVFISIASAVGNMSNMKRLGKILGSTLVTFIVTGIIAGIIMIAAVKLFPPVLTPFEVAADEVGEPKTVGELIVSFLTVSDFPLLFSRSNMLPLIVASIIFGFGVSICGGPECAVGKLLNNLSDIIMKVVSILMYYAPIGLFAFFASLIGEFGPTLIGNFGRAMLLYYPLCVLYFFIAFPLYARFAGGKGAAKKLFQHILKPAVTSLGTCSSIATIPANMEAAEEIGIPRDVSDIVLPLGATMHMDGSVFSAILKISFLFGFFGMPFDGIGTYVTALMIAIFSGIAMSGVAGGGFVGEMVIVSLFFPEQMGIAFPVIATIGALVDPPATCINASGDTVASMIVARFVEGKDWFQKKQAERAEKAGA